MEASWRAEATNLQDLRNHDGQFFSLCVSVSPLPRVFHFGHGLRCVVLGLHCAALCYVELLTYRTNLLPFRHSSREGKKTPFGGEAMVARLSKQCAKASEVRSSTTGEAVPSCRRGCGLGKLGSRCEVKVGYWQTRQKTV